MNTVAVFALLCIAVAYGQYAGLPNAANGQFGANLYGTNPYGANPYGANPFGANPYGANPYGVNSYSQYGFNPYSQYGMNPYGFNQYSQFNPYGYNQGVYGASPYNNVYGAAAAYGAPGANFGANLGLNRPLKK